MRLLWIVYEGIFSIEDMWYYSENHISGAAL